MKTISFESLIFILAISLFGCAQEDQGEESRIPITPSNYIVLLDLSDRILQPGQVEFDVELAFQLFEAFERQVRKNLTVNSNDRFCVLIADQKGIPYEDIQWENAFFLDMAKTNVAIKNKNLMEMRANLKKQLHLLYTEARYSQNPSDYSGADLWRFFHDRLPQYYDTNMENHLLVLSDGYFDFESRALTGQMQEMGTSTAFIDKIRNSNNWKELMVKNGYGIFGVDRDYSSLSVCIAGIRPKNQSLNEMDILRDTWLQWLEGMKACSNHIIAYGPLAGVSLNNY